MAGLQYDATLAVSARSMLALPFARLVELEPALRGPISAEAVHDARVAARRLRTLLHLFRRAFPRRDVRTLEEGLARLGDALAAVRDADVREQRLLARAGSAKRAPALMPLLARWRTERRGAAEALQEQLAGAEHRRWLERMETFLAATTATERGGAPLYERAPAMLWRLYGRVRLAATDLDHASADELHALRKAVRRLRYLLDALRGLLGAGADELIAAAVEVQDALGALHDVDVLRQELGGELERGADNPVALEALYQRCCAEYAASRKAFLERGPRLAGGAFRRRLARATAAP